MTGDRSGDLKFIHILRAVSVILICWDHMVPTTYYSLGIQPPASAVYRFVIWPLAITNFFGAFAVDVFFIITGYLTMRSIQKHKPLEFLAGRFVRLCPPIVFGLLVYKAFIFLAKVIGGGRFDWFDHSFFAVNGALWFLRVLIIFYILAAICIPVFKKDMFYGCLTVSLLAALGSQIGSVSPPPYIYIYIYTVARRLVLLCLLYSAWSLVLFDAFRRRRRGEDDTGFDLGCDRMDRDNSLQYCSL